MPGSLRPTLALAAAALAVLALACGEPTASSEPAALSPGDSLVATVAGTGDTARAALRVAEPTRVRIACHADGLARVWLQRVAADTAPPLLACIASADGVERWSDGDVVLPAGRYTLRAQVFDQTSPSAAHRVAARVYVVRGGPELRAAAFAVGDTVRGETLETPADVDTFTTSVTAGTTFVLFLQRASGDGPRPRLRAYARGACAMADGGSYDVLAGAAADLETEHTPLFVAAGTGTCTVTVRSPDTDAGPVPYAFQLRRADSTAESGRALTPDDTVAEAIDHVLDVDTWSVAGTPGDRYALYAQALGDGTYLRVRVGPAVTRDDDPLTVVVSGTPHVALLERSTVAFTMPASGRIAVTAEQLVALPSTRGPYRLFLYHVDPRPETAPASLTLGDSIPQERLALAHDEDVYELVVPTGTLASVALFRESPSDEAELRLDATGPVEFANWFSGSRLTTSEPMVLPAGRYALRVWSPFARADGFRGAYRMWTSAVDTLPEHTRRDLVAGDTTRDAIDEFGDRDVYTFEASPDRPLTLALAGDVRPEDGLPRANVSATWQAVAPQLGTAGGAYAGTPGAFRTGRIEVPTRQRLRVVVGGRGGTIQPWERGSYRLVLDTVRTAPEHAAALLALDGAPAAERVDRVGDVDDFVVAAPPGREVVLAVQHADSAMAELRMWLRDGSEFTPVEPWGWLAAGERFTAPLVMPASGRLFVRLGMRAVDGMVYDPSVRAVGAYAIRAMLVDPAPERAPASTAIGDTIAGERIDFPGDVDEFKFAAAAGDRLVVRSNYPDPTAGWIDLAIDVVAPDGSVLTMPIQTVGLSDTFVDNTTVAAVTSSGTYRLRVRGWAASRGGPRGAYRLVVARAP